MLVLLKDVNIDSVLGEWCTPITCEPYIDHTNFLTQKSTQSKTNLILNLSVHTDHQWDNLLCLDL